MRQRTKIALKNVFMVTADSGTSFTFNDTEPALDGDLIMRKILFLGIATLGGALLAGCSSPNEYSTGAAPTEMAAYAAKNPYPVSATAQDNPQLTAVVNHSN